MRDGYGMCRKRSSRLGGNFFCAVDNDSKCKDIKKEPNTGISVSVDACKHINIGRVPSNFRFYVLINFQKIAIARYIMNTIPFR